MKTNSNCLFCKIVSGSQSAKILYENERFVVVTDKFPRAPVHYLIISKDHVSKKDLQKSGSKSEFYSNALNYAHEVAKNFGLHEKGYEISAFYSGYNHFDHEHIHLLSGHH